MDSAPRLAWAVGQRRGSDRRRLRLWRHPPGVSRGRRERRSVWRRRHDRGAIPRWARCRWPIWPNQVLRSPPRAWSSTGSSVRRPILGADPHRQRRCAGALDARTAVCSQRATSSSRPGLADTIRRPRPEGAAPLRTGDLAAPAWSSSLDRAAALTRRPGRARAHGTRPVGRALSRSRRAHHAASASAGGALLAVALHALAEQEGAPTAQRIVAAMDLAQAVRTPTFARELTRSALRMRCGGQPAAAAPRWRRSSPGTREHDAPGGDRRPAAFPARSRAATASARGWWCRRRAFTSTT